jgi:hypothetical protein
MGTAFTYQGRLIDVNEAADGVYDFNFGLYDSASDGNKVGSDVDVGDVDVIEGYFTVALDFGSNVFDGNERWLEIGVRPGWMNDPNVYTELTPRQEVAPAPYALYAKTTGSGGGWVDDGAVVRLESIGDSVGIGTAGPGDKLDVAGHINSSWSYKLGGDTVLSNTGVENIFVGEGAGASANPLGRRNSAVGMDALFSNTWGTENSAMGHLALYSNTAGHYNSAMGDGAGYSNDAGSGNVFLGYKAGYNETGSNRLYIANSDTDPPLIYGQFDTGRIGIGTTSPDANLHVNGAIRLGSGGRDYEVNEVTTSDTGGWKDYIDWDGIAIGSNTGINRQMFMFTDGSGSDNIFTAATSQNSGGSWQADMVVQQNGRVGIGTPDPCDELHVKGSSYLQGIFESTSAAGGIQLRATNGQAYELQSLDSGDFILYDRTDGRYCMRVDNDGNVGIGTTDPSAKLDVNGDINVDSTYKIGAETVLSVDVQNTFIGRVAGRDNTTGQYNTFSGYGAGVSNTEGSHNTFLGTGTAANNTIGSENTCLGRSAGFNQTGGEKNVFVGLSAGFRGTSDSCNVYIGHSAGFTNTEESGNVCIGYKAGYWGTGSDKLYIANSSGTPLIWGHFLGKRVGIAREAVGNALEVEGNASKTTAGVWLANSDARIKTDIETVENALETLDKVRLVSFKYNDDYQAKHPSIEDRHYVNVIAQEFADVFPDYVKGSQEELPNGEEILQVDAYPLTVYSAAAVQELHEIVKAKDAEIVELKSRLDSLEQVVHSLASSKEVGL